MKIYKILRNDGLYSRGGMSPQFNKVGKSWATIGHVKLHINQLAEKIYPPPHIIGVSRFDYHYSNVQIIEYDLDTMTKRVIPMSQVKNYE